MRFTPVLFLYEKCGFRYDIAIRWLVAGDYASSVHQEIREDSSERIEDRMEANERGKR